MALLDKFKDTLDWGKRLQFLYQIVALLLSGSVIAGVRAMIHSTSIPPIWRWSIYLLCAALSLLLFASIGRWWSIRKKLSLDEARETIHDVKACAGKAALLYYMVARATELSRDLEALWHQWNNSGEKLIHPLDAKFDKLKDASSDEAWNLLNARRDFMVMYAHHIITMKVEFPDFTSHVMSAGYPAPYEYVQVRDNLKEHADQLEQMADKLWHRY
jgi:hypothetical protein